MDQSDHQSYSKNHHIGCAYESGIRYDGHDVDYSSYIPDLPSCLSYCKETSRFFTYDEGGNECHCKSSNVNPFVEEGTVSGESGCPPSKLKRRKEMQSSTIQHPEFQIYLTAPLFKLSQKTSETTPGPWTETIRRGLCL